MATAPIFDAKEWSALTGPISDDDPAGPDRNRNAAIDSLYSAIDDARRIVADAEFRLRRGQEINLDINKKWREIKKSTQDFLSSKSKDINVSIYLAEALVRLHGFAGLRDGLAVTAALVDGFGEIWKDRFETDQNISSFLGLLMSAMGTKRSKGLLRPPLLGIPISDTSANAPATWAAHIVARDTARLQVGNSGGNSMIRSLPEIETDIKSASRRFIDDLRDDLAAAAAAGRALDESLKRFAAGSGAEPSCAEIIDLVTEIRYAIVALLGEGAPAAADQDQAGGNDRESVAQGEVEQPAVAPAILHPSGFADREQALRQLLLIAEYFRGADPQSLVAPGLEEIVRRARLPWNELLSELLPDDKGRASFLLAAGIRWIPGGAEPK